MARRHRHHRRRNPVRWLGENVVDLAWEIGGLAAAAIANDQIVYPAVSKIVARFSPGLAGGGTLGKALNGATTAVTGFALGSVVEHTIGDDEGRLVKRGGVALGIGRIALAPLAGSSISVAIPAASKFTNPLSALTGGAPSAAPALPAASASAQPAATAFAGSQMGF